MAHEGLTRGEHIEGSPGCGFGLFFTGFLALITAQPAVQ